MYKILIIDDERAIRNTLREILEYEKFTVDDASDGAEGIKLIEKNKYDLILSDIKMPKMDGLEVLERVLSITPETPVVIISGHGNIETAVEALKKGAYDYIAKPIDMNRLLVTTRNALDKKQLVSETKNLKKKINKTFEMVGDSEAIQQIKELIERVAPTDARVLITGPNGSGKELVARWIHEKSPRSTMPLVEVNCAAIPSELIESELFGHEKGAFTSAIAQRKGKFELAEGGTLFLDEIGDMSLSAQAKVLRALQENKITRVGGDKEIKVNVRIITATNKNLRKEIEEGRFREDLFHRLSVIPIQVPSLNDRKEDIPLLITHFSKTICEENGWSIKSFTADATKELQKHNWSGNIRELRNVVERLLILGSKQITDKDVKMFAPSVG
ncbi:MAG: sigma-54-dependent Fis family transcriptional regulator [Bacteroidia bacterium]|nr:sigma-54-dependent Fis family transcriptional regulator [Bacteroidia bacterium]